MLLLYLVSQTPLTISCKTMAFRFTYLFLVVLILSHLIQTQSRYDTQANFFGIIKKSLKGSTLSNWASMADDSYCNYTGVSCDSHGYVTKIMLSSQSISGYFPPYMCSYLPNLQVFDIGINMIQGNFHESLMNCSQLQVLNLTTLHLNGELPDFSEMRSLKSIDLSFNTFQGDFPMSITNLTLLEKLNFNENYMLNPWELPENITLLKRLQMLVLTTCNLQGSIPPAIGNMTSLTDLELSSNSLVGPVPPEIGKLKSLKMLMLYFNQLTGTIPQELGNLTELEDLDMSVNLLTGKIPESVCSLPKLKTLQLYNNSLAGEIPEALGESKTLAFLSLYDNQLSGAVPRNLGKKSPMILFDLSQNQLSGELPPFICTGGKLLYFLVLENMFTGSLPRSYENCNSLLRFRVSYNRLEGSVPDNIFSLPHASIVDLAYNSLSGPIPKTIGVAKNLSELLVQNNRFSGGLPSEIAGAINLVKIDFSNNFLSGPVPDQIGSLKNLNSILLQGNKFNSSIPKSLSSLGSLSLLDLSNNQLTGNIPDSLSSLLPNSINFSNNQLSGPIPRQFIEERQEDSFLGNPLLCVTFHLNSTNTYFPPCPQPKTRKEADRIWILVVLLVVAFVGVILFLKRCLAKERKTVGEDETSSSSFSSYDIKSFHKISFEQREIVEAMVDKNILGHGGSGIVYRVGLSSGEVVAVKKLWMQKSKDSSTDEQLFPNKELETEVETLGSIRHKGIIKLYSYFSSCDCHLLVYEYMQNGNLWDALHKGKILLDWPTRHQIALGVARGLAYLHHNLMPPVIHRDIKSSNILLDVDYQPKVADFGVAKVLQAKGGIDSGKTVIAGTYGYLDPDYVKSSNATTKCDVYSFGVVLMELVTGKKPVEAEFGENKNIINWIASKADTREGAIEVLDKRLSVLFKDEMLPVLRIAMRCTARSPAPRPTMCEVVQLLIEANPCRELKLIKPCNL